MFKLIHKVSFVILLTGIIACSDSVTSSSEQQEQFEFMEPITTALASFEEDEATGKGIFILNWNGINPRFSNHNGDKLGMAMGVGFEEDTSLRPPHEASTVDMGTVSILSSNNEQISLEKQNSMFVNDRVVYRHRSFGLFESRSSLAFLEGGEYTLQTSGSDVFPSLGIKVNAPDKKMNILSPAPTRLQSHSGDLKLTWDAMPDRPVAIHIRPAIDPNSGQRPGQFSREDSEMILLKEHNGSATISAETLASVAEKSASNSVRISVGQLEINDIEVDGQRFRILMGTGDHRVVELN